MYVRFATIDEERNAFVWGDRRPAEAWLFAKMKDECSSSPDEPGNIIADLITDGGDILDVAVMNRQMRERALRILDGN